MWFSKLKRKLVKLCITIDDVAWADRNKVHKQTLSSLERTLIPENINEGIHNRVERSALRFIRSWWHPDKDALCMEIHIKVYMKSADWA